MTETKLAETPKHVFEIYIKTTAERLWRALTEGGETEKYYYGSRIESDWQQGSPYAYKGSVTHPEAGDATMIAGEILEIDPPRKLVMTFKPMWGGEAVESYPQSRVTWEIAPMGESCRLTLVHDELAAGNPLTKEFFSGWSCILSSLKTYVETGETLVITPPEQSR